MCEHSADETAIVGAVRDRAAQEAIGGFSRGHDRTVHGHSNYLVWLNRGTESMELDITDDRDRRMLDAPYGPYPAGAGNQVSLAVQRDREWGRPCQVVLRRPDPTGDPGGAVESLLPPTGPAGLEPAMGPVPRLGERNDVLRAEFGFRQEETQ